ncbi:hypothetical protein FEM48_Zijuj05G0190000 [Ziziphus jujuba var. spinosa]|uniref:Protein N-lysine methyltransferase METTL21A n=1 Tax=Ziziphus jujuba var. spinosa TaxID=714518 RepID=A0A978VGK6_ZIZJJ|nr:hypothetical protein FEM48_Zijuj05G0190000 [Ziziphus jujuba var. spinosa]
MGSEEEEEEESGRIVRLGSYGGKVRLLLQPSLEEEEESNSGVDEAEAAAEETMLLWGLQQPTLSKPNALVSQSSLRFSLDSCGHSLSILQSPSSLATPGVTGSVMWDSGVVLAKFLEHAVDSGTLLLHSKKIVELGSGCGLVGCIAALLGGQVILTDLLDRLRLLRKNVEVNLSHCDLRGSATVMEFIWGDDPDPLLIQPTPDFAIFLDYGLLDIWRPAIVNCTNCGQIDIIRPRGSIKIISIRALQSIQSTYTVVYCFVFQYSIAEKPKSNEGAVVDLLATLQQLCGCGTTIFLAGELRNDAILECFLEAAVKDFVVGRVDQTQWHPDYCSSRVVLYAMVKK